MTAEILTALIAANLAASAALLLALLLRRPLRRLVGARAAYAVWLLVPVAMLATLAPPRPATEVVLSAPIRPVAEAAVQQIAVLTGVATITPDAIAAGRSPYLSLFLYAWMAGAAAFALFLVLGQWRAVARFGLLGRDGEGYTRAANRDVGPALIGLLRPSIVLPTDFEIRFQPREQAMILAHEWAHLKHGHLWINALTALIRAINWFNPLVHVGAYYARVDQELACDAAVAERFPGERRTYAEAMLKTQLAAAPLPLGCYWPGGSSNLLQERIEMLASKTPTLARRLLGAAAISVLVGGAAYAAWAAADPATQDRLIDTAVPFPAGAAAPMDAIADPTADQTVDTALPATINLSNAGSGTSALTWGSLRGGRAAISTAIQAGDPARVYLLGGSPQDVAASLARMDPEEHDDLPGALSRGDEFRFVNAGGRLALTVDRTDPNPQNLPRPTKIIGGPQFANLVPPPVEDRFVPISPGPARPQAR